MAPAVIRRLRSYGPVEVNQDPPHNEAGSSLQTRAAWVKTMAAGGILAGLALSPRLWVSSRYYPVSPIAPILSRIPQPWDVALLGSFIATLVAIMVISRPQRVFWAASCMGVFLVCIDQSRLQPWFYQYLLMLIAVSYFYTLRADTAQRAGSINACRMIVASIYVWSGIQKLNPGFASELFPWLIRPVLNILPPHIQELALRAGALAPWIEIAIGGGLLISSLRRTAVCMAVAMHCLLLLDLGPIGLDTNNVVWAWNVVMGASVVVLFGGSPSVRTSAIVFPGAQPFRWFLLIVGTIAPALSLSGAWDHYPSWALYSGARNEAVIYITDRLFDRLPAAIQNYVYEDRHHVNRVDIYRWSAIELNAPVYPEVRVYRNIAKLLCRYSADPADVRLEVTMRGTLLGTNVRKSTYSCSSL